MPILSVILSVRNGERFLPQALESIAHQTFQDFTCLVLDDGSTDSSGLILDTWARQDRRFRITRILKSQGLTKSLNHLLSLVQTPYVARHDADDISDPDRFQKQLTYLESHPEISLVGSAFDLVDDDGTRFGHTAPPVDPGVLKSILRRRNILAHGSWFARAEALKQLGGYRPFFRYAQDYDLLLRLIEGRSIASLPETLYQLRMSAGGLSFEKQAAQAWYAKMAQQSTKRRAHQQADDTWLQTQTEPPALAGTLEEARYGLDLMKAVHALKRGHSTDARRFLLQLPWTYRPIRQILLMLLTLAPSGLRSAAIRQSVKL